MSRIWSEEGKLARWLEVELAALDGWAEVGAIPAEDVAAIRAGRDGRRRPSASPRSSATTDHDTAAFVDAVAEQLGPEGRWLHYGLTSSDVVDTALALQIQDAGTLDPRRARPRDRRGRRAAPRSTAASICIGRTHGIHAEPTTFGWKLAGWAFELDRDRTRLARALESNRVGQLSGTVGTLRRPRPRGRAHRLRAARARARPALDAGDRARPPRRAALGARAHRDVARAVRDRDPPPRAHRGARGRGAVRAGHEGLLGDAAQAQPEGRRADLRASRASCARPRSSGSRTSSLWHERDISHSSAERVVDPRRVPRARLHARPLHLDRRRASSSTPSGCCGTSTPRTGSSSRTGCCSRSSRRACRATRPTGSSSGTRCGPGTRSATSASSSRPTPRSPRASTRPRSTASSTSQRPSSTSTPCFDRLRTPRPEGGPVHV